MDNVSDLSPQTTREWLQHINNKLDLVLQSQEEDREAMVKFIEKTDCWISDHNMEATKRSEKIEQLEKKVNSWSLINTITAIVAAVAAFFGIRIT